MATPEEEAQFAKLRAFLERQEMPAAPVTACGPEMAAPDGIFGMADLLALPLAEDQAAPFPMPGGKRLWVHPLQPDEAAWCNERAAAEIRKLREPDAAESAIRRKVWLDIYQVIAVCRVGPTQTDAPVFKPSAAAAISANLGWERVERIVALSNRLGGEGEDAQIVDFFANALSLLQTCGSRLSTGDGSGCQAALAAFAGLADSIRLRGRLLASDVTALQAIAGEPGGG